jgi:hypothetical protein
MGPHMSRHSKFLARKRRQEKRLAARTDQSEQQPDRLVCGFCGIRPAPFLVGSNVKNRVLAFVAWDEDLTDKEFSMHPFCGDRHCLITCWDKWLAQDRRREQIIAQNALRAQLHSFLNQTQEEEEELAIEKGQ